MKKRIFGFLTLLCMIIALLPANIITVSAYNETKYGDYLYYTVSGGKVTISGCDSSATKITIPSTIGDYPVTSIGNYAFSWCSGLTSITIPSSVTSIGYGAFSNCSGLTKVNITDIDAWCNINFGNSDSNPLYYAKNCILTTGL